MKNFTIPTRLVNDLGFKILLFNPVNSLKHNSYPQLHEGHFIMHMTAFPGTSESESIRIGNEVSEKILSIQGVKSVAQWVGRVSIRS